MTLIVNETPGREPGGGMGRGESNERQCPTAFGGGVGWGIGCRMDGSSQEGGMEEDEDETLL